MTDSEAQRAQREEVYLLLADDAIAEMHQCQSEETRKAVAGTAMVAQEVHE